MAVRRRRLTDSSASQRQVGLLGGGAVGGFRPLLVKRWTRMGVLNRDKIVQDYVQLIGEGRQFATTGVQKNAAERPDKGLGGDEEGGRDQGTR